jgi:hypothetical protein
MRCVFLTPRGGSEAQIMCEECGKGAGAVSVRRTAPLVLVCPGCGSNLH